MNFQYPIQRQRESIMSRGREGSASRFPSPLPSPQGRGGIEASHLTLSAATVSPRRGRACSLSPRGRAGGGGKEISGRLQLPMHADAFAYTLASPSTLVSGLQHLRPAVLLGLLLVLSGCHPAKNEAEAPEAKVKGDTVIMPTNSPQLATLSVEPVGAEQPASIALTGRLVWDEDATVRVFTPFAGIVRSLFVDVNQPVTKGMPLAEIQSPDFGQAQADARKAASDLRRADQNLTRLRDLFEHGAAPRKDLESTEADYASAQAEKDRAEARLAIYGMTATSTNQEFLLPSPLTGILVERNVTPGQEVRPDQMLANMPQFTAPLFVVTDPSRLWIQIDATELDLPHLRPGRELTFTSRAFPGQTFTGRVDTVSEFIDPRSE